MSMNGEVRTVNALDSVLDSNFRRYRLRQTPEVGQRVQLKRFGTYNQDESSNPIRKA